MPSVAIDTSALMLPVELDILLFDELERLLGEVTPLVPESVVTELEQLAEGQGTEGRAARVGLALVESSCQVVESPTSVADDAVLTLATDGTADYVVTADRPLVDRAHEAGLPAITPRGRRQLSIQPP